MGHLGHPEPLTTQGLDQDLPLGLPEEDLDLPGPPKNHQPLVATTVSTPRQTFWVVYLLFLGQRNVEVRVWL